MGALKDYFSFSKRERTGAIVLIILIVLIFAWPEFYPKPPVYADQKEMDALKRLVSKSKTFLPDSSDGIERSTSSNY